MAACMLVKVRALLQGAAVGCGTGLSSTHQYCPVAGLESERSATLYRLVARLPESGAAALFAAEVVFIIAAKVFSTPAAEAIPGFWGDEVAGEAALEVSFTSATTSSAHSRGTKQYTTFCR